MASRRKRPPRCMGSRSVRDIFRQYIKRQTRWRSHKQSIRLGLLKSYGRVYRPSMPNSKVKAKTLIPIIEFRMVPDSIVYSGSFTSYDVLDISSFQHRRIDHGKGFVDGEENRRHINDTLKLLEPGKTTSTQIQRHSAQALLLLPQRVRMAL